MNKSFLRKLSLPLFFLLTGMWWGWTLLVDIFVVPTVFRTVDNFFQAGELGIQVFSKLNNLEVIVSSFIVAILALHSLKYKRVLSLLIVSSLLWIIAMTYFTYLTPKIIELTDLWRKTEEIGLTGVKGIPDVQQAHQFYHNLYIKIDVLKLVLLSTLLGLGFWKQEELR